MESEWMGRYRPLVAALVQHANVVTKNLSAKNEVYKGIFLNPNEWQVLEYIVEHRDNIFSMIDISHALGIPQSSFSKLVKTLQMYNLAEKYMAEGNKKNVIIRPTEKAIEVYNHCVAVDTTKKFQPFFDRLKDISDEDLKTFVEAIDLLSGTLESPAEPDDIKLIKKE